MAGWIDARNHESPKEFSNDHLGFSTTGALGATMDSARTTLSAARPVSVTVTRLNVTLPPITWFLRSSPPSELVGSFNYTDD